MTIIFKRYLQNNPLPIALRRWMMKGLLAIFLIVFWVQSSNAQRQMEQLDRGVVAVPAKEGKAFVSWRLLATDEPNVAFNVYRISGEDLPRK